jgi:hypothetical protein
MAHQSYNISNFHHPLIKTHKIKTANNSLYSFNFDIIEFIILILAFDKLTIYNKRILSVCSLVTCKAGSWTSLLARLDRA